MDSVRLNEMAVIVRIRVCVSGGCGGQLNAGTQRISFFSFEVSSNALQRLFARMTAQEEEGGVHGERMG